MKMNLKPNRLNPEDIHVFNTGRQYTRAGQRIAWAILSKEQDEDFPFVTTYDIVFSDLDRMIWGRMEVPIWDGDLPNMNEEILRHYDGLAYQWDPLADELNDQLREAARKL